jgi:hypothetical protein
MFKKKVNSFVFNMKNLHIRTQTIRQDKIKQNHVLKMRQPKLPL